jgi:chemotaxis protein CheX
VPVRSEGKTKINQILQRKLSKNRALIEENIMFDSEIDVKSSAAEVFLSPASLECIDASVIEVFSMMFGFAIDAVESPETAPDACGLDERTAVIGFAGKVRGSFQVRISFQSARKIASAMLGGAPVDDDASIADALGELCNMIAGGWKNAIPIFSECTLSPPTVISGQDYKLHFHRPSMKILRAYRFDGHTLNLTLHCELS